MRNVLKTEPCAREGLLYGMGVGTAVAVLRIFKGRSMVSAGNWGFVAFGVVAVVAKQLCHFQYAHQSAKLNTLFETRSKQALKVRGFEHSEADRPQEKHD
ncbi:hypothetical protein GGI20_003154 [Coemansia sp. BCRC 34301]|nr:hypothetical protein GGI20_003154 [Coemansia sp. BCRC 34301]